MNLHRHVPQCTVGFAVTIAAAVAALPFCATPVLGQLSSVYLATSAGQHLTPQEKRDVDVALIAPHYSLYTDWNTCLIQGGDGFVPQAQSAEAAADVVFPLCQNHEGELQASLAREMGLTRARRVAQILRENMLVAYRVLYTKLHTPAQNGVAGAPGWKLLSVSGGCMAGRISQGPIAPQAIAISMLNTEMTVMLRVYGSDAHARAKTFASKPFATTIVLWKQGTATKFGNRLFSPISTNDGFIVSTPLSPDLARAMADADTFQMGSMESFPINDVPAVIGAIQRCAGGH